MAVIQGMMTRKTFNEIEIDAMKLAGHLGISPKDKDGLNLIAKIVHNARRPGKSYISVSVEDCRRLLAWMDR